MELEEFVSHLDGVRRLPSGYSARCPAHDDRVASLSVNAGRDGGIVCFCHAGCDITAVVTAMGLQPGDLVGAPRCTTTYPYTDEDGNWLYSVERWVNPKTFRCVPNLPAPALRVPYNAVALKWAREHHATVYVVEGEKDVDRLTTLHLPATCNVGGAGPGKWLSHYSSYLQGLNVVVVADNDAPGRAHARAVATSLQPHAANVVTVHPRYGGDLSDLLDAGWGLDCFDALPEEDDLGAVVAANVVPRAISWAWSGYIPLGKITIIEGDPGDGKSMLSIDLAARWTSGLAMPDVSRHGGPWPVVMVTAEDDIEDTIAPRLRAAGADMSLVRLIDHGTDETRPFSIAEDMPALYRTVMDAKAKIVILDPLMAFIGEATDSHNDASTRRALFPLYRLAKDLGVAVVTLRHLNKGSGRAIYRGGGSIAFVGAARVAFTVGRDPEDRTRRIIANVKMNIAPEPPSMAYTVENSSAGPYIQWHGIVDADAQEVLDGEGRIIGEEAIEFLDTVVENGQPITWREIVAAGKKAGFTEKQLRSRRHRSRLMMIPGGEGRRSTRWGYLEHTLSGVAGAESHVPDEPEIPHLPSSDSRHMGVNGQGGHLAEPSQTSTNQTHTPEEDDTPNLVCDVCGATEGVTAWEEPEGVVRCRPHNPRTYHGGS